MKKSSMTKQKFINQWLRHFAPALTRQQYENYIKDQYIWHVFSWELAVFDGLLTAEDARRAFNEEDKSDCICCDLYNGSGVSDQLPSQFDTAEKIDSAFSEFYVVARDYSWTYIKTHEGDLCGPYFLKKQ